MQEGGAEPGAEMWLSDKLTYQILELLVGFSRDPGFRVRSLLCKQDRSIFQTRCLQVSTRSLGMLPLGLLLSLLALRRPCCGYLPPCRSGGLLVEERKGRL